MGDRKILNRIEDLISEEQQLFAKGEQISDDERKRLKDIEIELDQYWDLLRQRRALRDAGKDPCDAKLRSKNTVENYEQ
jgi:uncharacterized protein YjaG (DUF416 family)